MQSSRWLVAAAAASATVIAGGVALAAAPWPGLAKGVASGDVRYTASPGAGATTVTASRVRDGKVLLSATFEGAYGIPAVTSNGLPGGLSPDGRLLVLVEPPTYQGLRARSRFLVLSTRSLALERTVVLRGEFGFDALSPDGRTLYLIQRTSRSDLVSYVVRAYDLKARRLLARVIVDKSQLAERMRGWPVARATSTRGDWVYTLYDRGTPSPFVHALNAAGRTAFCVDLPQTNHDVWRARLELRAHDRRLVVRSGAGATIATIDTTSLRVR
jgi:hypothetical protein